MRYGAFKNLMGSTPKSYHIHLAGADEYEGERLAGIAGSTFKTLEKAQKDADRMNEYIRVTLKLQEKA